MNEELRPEYALRWGQERACERKYENARFSTELMGKGRLWTPRVVGAPSPRGSPPFFLVVVRHLTVQPRRHLSINQI
jgi:hypothetical protein